MEYFKDLLSDDLIDFLENKYPIKCIKFMFANSIYPLPLLTVVAYMIFNVIKYKKIIRLLLILITLNTILRIIYLINSKILKKLAAASYYE